MNGDITITYKDTHPPGSLNFLHILTF